MPAFLKLGDIQGEASDSDHKCWILVESMSAPVHRSIQPGARDMERIHGETTLGDVVIVRRLDKSSPKLVECCANGTLIKEVDIHLCTAVKNKQEPYLTYKLHNVIVSSYSFHGNAAADPPPSEEISLSYSAVDWTYSVLDPKSGDKKGQVAAKYDVSEGHG